MIVRCSVWSHQKTLFVKLNSRNAPPFKQDMMISANDDHQAIFDHDWPSQFWPQSITLSTIENVTHMTYHMSLILSRYNISEIWFRMKKIEMIQNENFNLFKTDLKPNYGQK